MRGEIEMGALGGGEVVVLLEGSEVVLLWCWLTRVMHYGESLGIGRLILLLGLLVLLVLITYLRESVVGARNAFLLRESDDVGH